MLKSFKNLGKNPDPQQVLAALRELYLLAFALLAVPAGIMGLLLGTSTAKPVQLYVWLGISFVLTVVVFASAQRLYTEATFKHACLVAMRLGLAVALPMVFAAASWQNGWYVAVNGLFSAGLGAVGWMFLKRFCSGYSR